MTISITKKLNAIEESSSIQELDLKYYPGVDVEDYYFISYSHKDYKEVYKDLIELKAVGLNYWYDRGIPVSMNWKEIAGHFMKPLICKGVIFYISENSLKDEETTKQTLLELRYAKECGKNIIAINLETEIENDGKLKKSVMSGEELMDHLIKNGRKDLLPHRDEFAAYFPKETLYLSINEHANFKKEKIEGIDDQPKLILSRHEANDESEEFVEITRVSDSTILNVKEDEFHKMLLKNGVEEGGVNVKVAQCAFANCSNLETVAFSSPSIGIGVDVIGDYAFKNCLSLESVDLAETNYVTIGSGAFFGCEKLKRIDVPIVEIGSAAFYGCKALETLEVAHTAHYPESCFFGCSSLKTVKKSNFYPVGALNEPSRIGSYAFAECLSLQEVYIPQHVVAIGEYAFKNCKSLEIITLSPSIHTIEDNAFDGCTSLSLIALAGAELNINFPKAFSNCPNLERIILSEGNKEFKVIDGAIYQGDTLVFYPSGAREKTLFLAENCKKIAEGALVGNPYLKEIILDNNYRFSTVPSKGCPNLKCAMAREDHPSLKTIDGALYDKEGKKLLYVPKGSVKKVFKMPDNVESFHPAAFVDIKDIEEVIFSPKIKTIEINYPVHWKRVSLPKALTSNPHLININGFDSMTIEGSELYSNYEGSSFLCQKGKTGVVLKYVPTMPEPIKIPEGITSIGEHAFDDVALITLSLPSSLKEFIPLEVGPLYLLETLEICKATEIDFGELFSCAGLLNKIIYHGNIADFKEMASKHPIPYSLIATRDLSIECDDGKLYPTPPRE